MITRYGQALLLGAALRGPAPTLYAALVDGVFSPTMQLADLVEPTQGVNGYGRKVLAGNLANWPTSGLLNGESFAETGDLVWTATGVGFDKPIRRMALLHEGNVVALSGALPATRTILATTPAADRTFRFRFYLGF